MPGAEVSSELYAENQYETSLAPTKPGNVVSHFPFSRHSEDGQAAYDSDGDLVLSRPSREYIQIEHALRTRLSLVALQVWRGSLLLADLLMSWGQAGRLEGRTVLELGAGTGLASIVASFFAKTVICTDLDGEGILDLIKVNEKRNAHLIKSRFIVSELDFNKRLDECSPRLKALLPEVDIVLAADVIYDDDITAAFMTSVQRLLSAAPPKSILVALEKRFVFTIENLDSVAPCYETFLSLLGKLHCDTLRCRWRVEQLPLDFPRCFLYERVEELVLWKITSTLD